jgi:hypothetical protein
MANRKMLLNGRPEKASYTCTVDDIVTSTNSYRRDKRGNAVPTTKLTKHLLHAFGTCLRNDDVHKNIFAVRDAGC